MLVDYRTINARINKIPITGMPKLDFASCAKRVVELHR